MTVVAPGDYSSFAPQPIRTRNVMSLKQPSLSAYAQASSAPSPVARMMASFASEFREGTDVNLGVGYVNEDGLPRAALRDALDKVLDNPQTYRNALNYGSARGSPNLFRATRSFLLRNAVNGLTAEVLDRNRLVFGANGATSLLEAIAASLPRGVVVMADPLYYIYSSFLARLGFELLPIPEDAAGIRADLLERRLPEVLDRLSFFYVVTVGNPSARMLTNQRRSELLSIATAASTKVGRKIPLVIDGAYDLLIHDPDIERPRSALLEDTNGVAYELGTFSKLLAPALRTGYLLGPPGPLVDVLVQRNNDVGLGPSLLNQEITSILLDCHADAQIEMVNARYRDKALGTRQLLERYLGDAIEDLGGGHGGFYYYLSLKDLRTDEGSPFYRFCTRSTGDPKVDGDPDQRQPRVIYLPGTFFVYPKGDLAERGKRQLRISYGFEGLAEIERGIEVMRDAIAFARRR